MVKRALKSAIGVSLGVAIGGTVLPRLLRPWFYNNTYPPLWIHALLNFSFAYAACFLIYLFAEWIKSKRKS